MKYTLIKALPTYYHLLLFLFILNLSLSLSLLINHLLISTLGLSLTLDQQIFDSAPLSLNPQILIPFGKHILITLFLLRRWHTYQPRHLGLAVLLQTSLPLLDQCRRRARLVCLREEHRLRETVCLGQEVDATLDIANLPQRSEGDVVRRCGSCQAGEIAETALIRGGRVQQE